MKKLMFAAAAAVMTSGAFAAPLVYDYKASVKHLYLKSITISSGDYKGRHVYQKFQKSTSLKGYLIMDQDGVTSPTINAAERARFQYNGFDYGRNRGFLVVINPKAHSSVRHAKILPAVLDAKWLDTAFTKNHTATSGLAEGTLYVGGDAVAPVRQQLDLIGGTVVGRNDGADPAVNLAPAVPVAGTADATGVPGMVAAADYLWTSIYLFAGSTQADAFYNGPNWFQRNRGAANANSPFGAFEYAWDINLPLGLRTGWVAVGEEGENLYAKNVINFYHDTWMNGAGFGKWTSAPAQGHQCCGLDWTTGGQDLTLESLSGNLKGGLFLCTENGIEDIPTEYRWFDTPAHLGCQGWEDQFNTARLEDGSGLFGSDAWQNDLWQDGFMEQETTDVISGTWSIKLNTKFYAEKNPIYRPVSAEFIERYFPNTDGRRAIVDTWLWGAINGAALKLDSSVTLYDGTEIYNKTSDQRANVPMLTPQFVDYYRLAVTNPIN